MSSKKGERALLSQLKKKKGVLRLYDEQKNVIFINGAMNLKQELSDRLELCQNARFNAVIEDPMFSKRASEMLQNFIVKHEKMTKVNQEMEDLF